MSSIKPQLFYVCDKSEMKDVLHTGKMNDGKPELKRLSLSPSKMLTYDECKLKFKDTILVTGKGSSSIYTCTGTAAHYVVEQINKGIKLSTEMRDKLVYEKLIEECAKEHVSLSFTPSFKESRELIRAYEPPKGYKLVEGELLHQLEFELYTFRYIIDALFVSDDGKKLLIVDYKTNAQPPKSNLQLLLYAWATSICRPDLKDLEMRASFYMLRTGKQIWVDVSKESIKSTQEYMDKSVSIIEKLFRLEHFPAEPGPGCHWCPLQDCEVRAQKQ